MHFHGQAVLTGLGNSHAGAQDVGSVGRGLAADVGSTGRGASAVPGVGAAGNCVEATGGGPGGWTAASDPPADET